MTSFQPDTSNREFRKALELIKYTRQSLFLTGKAGTGKSTFLRYICDNVRKKHVVLAPTGIAAINAGGSTPPPSTPGAARCTASSACPSTRCCRTTPT